MADVQPLKCADAPASSNQPCSPDVAGLGQAPPGWETRHGDLTGEKNCGRDQDAGDEFLTHVSHELRTPLSAMLLWINLLMSHEDVSPSIQEGLGVIKKAAEEQQTLIEALVALSLIKTGKFAVERRPTELAHVVRAAVETMRPEAEERRVVLETSLDKTVGWVAVDTHRFHRVVLNLLGNAIRSTPAGGRVSLRLRREQEQVTLQVADTGEGIDLEALPRIFEIGEPGTNSAPPKLSGLGLGLMIARRVVQLHGGSIVAYSAGRGQGATFTVELPLESLDPLVARRD